MNNRIRWPVFTNNSSKFHQPLSILPHTMTSVPRNLQNRTKHLQVEVQWDLNNTANVIHWVISSAPVHVMTASMMKSKQCKVYPIIAATLPTTLVLYISIYHILGVALKLASFLRIFNENWNSQSSFVTPHLAESCDSIQYQPQRYSWIEIDLNVLQTWLDVIYRPSA